MKIQNPKRKIRNSIVDRLWRTFAAGLTVLFISGLSFAKPPNIGELPPLHYTPPEPTRVVLSNGIVVYLLEDHELPLFDLNIKMKVSPADQKPDRQGSMSFLGTVWRAGGTKKRSPTALNQELEMMPAQVETGANEEAVSISLSSLSL